MRLTVAAGNAESGGTSEWEGAAGPSVHGITTRRVALALVLALVLSSIGIVFSPAKRAGAATVFQSGQVFASTGNSTVSVYDPSSGNLLTSLTDNTSEPYTAGTAWDSHGNLYVADDTVGDISVYKPDGTLDTEWNNGAFTSGATTGNGVFAYGLTNPLSIVFDNVGNVYVGQQTTPYIAEFNSSGARQPDIGPVQTELYGADWIDLAKDQCTFYYTTEGSNIHTFNKCTNSQGPNFNTTAFPTSDTATNLPVQAFELKILSSGEVLVADSNAVLLLDQSGNVVQTYPCSTLPSCGGQLFAVSVDPSGQSFWTGDSASGDIYEINIASGNTMQTIATHSGTLYGLSVLDQLEVATPPPVTQTVPSSLAIQPVTGNFSTPTPVTAVLTNPSTGTPIVNEPVTFTLNGTQSCTSNTDATGTATCTITAGQPSATYTLTASFSGDASTSTPIGSNSTSTNFTVTPDTSALTYTGPTTAVNGQPLTLTGSLTTNVPSTNTALPTKVVTFTIGSGSSAQTCSAVTDASGNVSCTIPVVNQPTTAVTITSSFTGDVYDTSSTVNTPATVTEPTTLTVNTATSDYSDAVSVSGVLKDSVTNAPISGEPVTLQLNGAESCTATTDPTGTATCSITPGEPTGTYALTGAFPGDTTLPLQLTGSNGTANFVVTLEETALTYTGPLVAQNGQPLTVSGVLTTDSGSAGVAGRAVTFTLGSGSSAQTCIGSTSSTGAVSCVINVSGQPQGPIPVTDTFAGDTYYQTASASATVNLPEGTKLTVTSVTGSYNGPTTVTATLVNTYTNAPVPNEPVTLTFNGSQTCSASTNASGVASCNITPTTPPGTYSVSASFGGDTTTTPVLLSSSGTGTFTETKAMTTLTYTGSTTTTSGQVPNLSATLTTANGTPVPGQPVTFTVGTGWGSQTCTATTNAAGVATCHICHYNQMQSPLPVTVTYGGNTYYTSAGTSATVTVVTPTTLVVNATSASFGQSVTLSGTLVNGVTGWGVPGQTVTLTLNGAQNCTATTDNWGRASCTVTPNEPIGTYAVTGTYGGNTGTSPQLLGSNGSNQVVITGAPTTIVYTGATTTANGASLTLSATLTSNGTPLPSGQTVTLTLGSGSSAQTCTATTNASGAASCTISKVNQISGTVPVTVSYAGNSTYAPTSSSTGVTIPCPGGGSGGGGGGGGGPCGGGGGGCGGCGSGHTCRPPCGGGHGCC